MSYPDPHGGSTPRGEAADWDQCPDCFAGRIHPETRTCGYCGSRFSPEAVRAEAAKAGVWDEIIERGERMTGHGAHDDPGPAGDYGEGDP